MGSRRSIRGISIVGLVLLVAAVATLALGLAGSASSAAAAPTDTTYAAASLSGAQEVPPNASAGTGSATVVLNTAGNMITVDVSFSGLGSNANGAHIHGPAPAGMNANIVFPLSNVPNSTSGTIPTQQFAISAAQVADLNSGLYYVNVHSVNIGSGEIRGQLARQGPTAVRIVSATAARSPRGVLVRWRTAAETQTLGFNVYRQQVGKLVKLNRTLIRNLGSAARGQTYAWLDRNAPGGRVTYRLQAVGRDGTRAWLSSTVAA